MSANFSWLRSVAALIVGLGGSSAVLSEPVKENIGLYGGNVMDIATMDNSGTTEVLIAVDNSQRGVYQYQATSGSMPDHWFSTTNPPTGTSSAAVGAIPGFASQVEADAFIPGHVYATVSNERTDEYGVLYFNSDFGSVSSVSPMTVGWMAVQDPTSSNPMMGIQVLKAGPTGVFASSHREIYEVSNGAVMGLTFSLDSMSGYEAYEIVDFTIATSSLAYATIRSQSDYDLISIDLTTGTPETSATATILFLPSLAPVEQRTGSCPIDPDYCMVSAELVAADPADTTGNTIYVAGSSVNAMVFKSTDGGNTWDQGYDYQCSADTSRTTASCTAYGFTDGYPRGDVVRFRGTSATNPGESRHVFIGRVVFDNDNVASGWQTVPRLRSLIRPSGASGSAIYQETNANDPALAMDPNDSTKFYIATDLAIGTFSHDPSSGFSAPYAGSELANARGIEGLIVNDLDYFENAPDDKQLWIVSKSGAAFAKNYDPTDPSSVATAGDWVYPIYAGGDGAPHRAVVIDPNDKSNVIIGTSKLYLNETGDAIDPSTGSVDYSLVANPINWTRVFEPQNFAADPSVDPSTTDPLFSSNVERSYVTALEWQTAGSCDRVYMSVANTDEGDVGGIFYSDDDGATWTADTLNGGSPRLSMPVNDLLVNDNFIWAGVGDRDGRSSEAGVRARVSYCGTSAWWKPTSSDPIFTDIQANDYVAALDGVSTPSDTTYNAVLYMASSNETTTRLTKASKERDSVSGCSSFDCWQFSDVTPPNTYGSLNAVAVEPHDADHVWAAYSNCIVESTDGGATWAEFGGSCTDDHEEIRTLVYDDLIAGTSSGAFAYAEEANFAVMDGVFGGFVADGDTFTFPTGSESWAGVANTNTTLYPMSFPDGGEVLFRAAIPEGGADTNIRFVFEANPSPNNTVVLSTENVLISGGLMEYWVDIPPHDPNQTFNSFLMYIVERDQSVIVEDIEVVMSGDEAPEMDTDMDGIPDDEDAFPSDPAASVDDDMDGMPDAWNDDATSLQIADSNLTLDEDDDNDGFSDTEEMADGSDPLDPTSIPYTIRSRIPFLIPILSEGPE